MQYGLKTHTSRKSLPDAFFCRVCLILSDFRYLKLQNKPSTSQPFERRMDHFWTTSFLTSWEVICEKYEKNRLKVLSVSIMRFFLISIVHFKNLFWYQLVRSAINWRYGSKVCHTRSQYMFEAPVVKGFIKRHLTFVFQRSFGWEIFWKVTSV